MKKIKTLGHRKPNPNPTWQEANRWLQTISQLRKGKGICPKGIYRFSTFEEANEWMIQMLTKSSHE